MIRARSIRLFPLLLVPLLGAPTQVCLGSDVVLNEFLARNRSGIVDEDGDTSDWVEIYNAGVDPATLTGMGLSDKPETPLRWTFSERTLGPGEFLIVWASDKDRQDSLHTNFSLSRDGESLILSASNGALLDRIDFGEQAGDVSMGRFPDGATEVVSFVTPTPGGANLFQRVAPPPLILPEGGFVSAGTIVSASTPLAGGVVRYTADGSTPTETGIILSGTIEIDATTVIRARTFASGYLPSQIETRTYLVGDAGTLPSVSLVTDPAHLHDASTGIFANPEERGDEWERPVSVEFFDPGSESFRVEAGLRTHGNFSRNFPKKSMRLHFSADYGPDRLEREDLFPNQQVESFKRLILSGGSNDSSVDLRPEWASNWTLARDAIMNEILRQVGAVAIDQRPVRLFLNGEPLGIFRLKERLDRFFIEDHFGYPDYDLLKRDFLIEAVEGTVNEWFELGAYFVENDFADPAVYEYASSKIDVDNFIDHYFLEMWAGNFDWPQNNNYILRPRLPNGLTRWIAWDTDVSLASPSSVTADRDFYPHMTGEHILGLDWATVHFRKIVENESFRDRFLNRICGLFNSSLEEANLQSIFDREVGSLRPEIAFEIDRWGSTPEIWERNIGRIEEFLESRNDRFLEHTRNFFGLAGTYALRLDVPSGMGTVRVNRIETETFPWSGEYFQNIPLPLAALPAPGYRFSHWERVEGEALPAENSIVLTTDRDVQLRAVFVPLERNARPNEVIINEYWNNDDETPYTSLEGRPLSGDWIELLVTAPEGIDLRNWRLTNNDTKSEVSTADPDSGSILFRPIPEFANLPRRTAILIVADTEEANPSHFDVDDLDPSDGRLVLYVGNNGALDTQTDPGFNILEEKDALVLLAPGASADFSDDVGVDFVAEGMNTTPASFGVSFDNVVFENPFRGIGGADGAFFTNDPQGGFNNDDGSDNLADGFAGPGGWVVDPPGWLPVTGPTPGRLNAGQVFPAGTAKEFDLDDSGRIDLTDLIRMLEDNRKSADPFRSDFSGNQILDGPDFYAFTLWFLREAEGK